MYYLIMNSYIGPFTDTIVNTLIDEFNKKENKKKIMDNVIEPILYEVTSKYYPQVLTLFVILITITLLLIIFIVSEFTKNISGI